jgi:hypothetical protein
MKKLSIMLFLIIIILYGSIGNAEQCIGPKIKGFCLGMTYNEVMENLKKLNLKVTKKDFDGGFFVLINEGKPFLFSLTIYNRDKLLHVMSFTYDILNVSTMTKTEFVEMFCKKLNIPQMSYKFDGEWFYEYINKQDGYTVTIYDKSVKIGADVLKSKPKFD